MRVNNIAHRPSVIEDILPRGSLNRPGIKMQPQWITVHNTGNPGVTAAQHAQYLKGNEAAKRPVSWHFTVDDRGAYQHLPLDETGWHAGDGRGPGNTASIGVEVCEVADKEAAETHAIMLIAGLLVDYDLFISNVVPHRKWYPTHCPRLILPRWDEFTHRVDTWRYVYDPKPWNGDKEIEVLREKGIIDSPHKKGDRVTWAEFATVINRLH